MKNSQKLRSKRPAILATGIATLFIALSGVSSPAAVTYIGEMIVDGSGTDLSGLNGAILEDGVSRNNALNGFGSGFAYAGGNTFYGLADRGPNKVAYSGGTAVDNTTSYPNRVQKFSITVTPSGSSPTGFSVNAANTGTTLLKNAAGVQYTGYSTGYQNNPNTRLDSEGVRVAPDGSFWVSDEYGPYILHFNQAGQQIGSLPLPAGWSPTSPQANAAAEAYPTNTVGRTTNRGMEGLAITPDGKTLVAMLQSSLIQDGGLKGSNCRILVYDLTNPSAAPKQFLYYLDGVSTPISELLAVNNHQFLVDERDGVTGTNGIKKLYMFDLNQATPPTDLTNTAYSGSTATNGLIGSATNSATGSNAGFALTPPPGVTTLAKTLFADIGSILNTANTTILGGIFSNVNSGGAILPDKIEGYAWGPDLPDGRHLLLATNDNDFATPTGPTGFPNYIWAFAVDPSDVPGFQPQVFDTDATNNINHIVVIYQENWSFDGLYGSFPGANGVTNASANSLNQIDRLGGAALSAETGTNTFNRISQTNNTTNSTVVAANTNSNLGNLNNPPPPLGSATGTAASNPTVVDTRFLTNPADATSATLPNTLLPWSLSNEIDPTKLTGDIVHRYWQEQFQIFGAINNDTDNGNNSGFITWSDNPGLVMSHFDGTNLPEGLLAQQYTMCDNFCHSAFGGSFLNHQFLIAAQAPVYYGTVPIGSVAYLDTTGLLVLNTSNTTAGRQVQDGSITPVAGDVFPSLTINGSAQTSVAANAQAFAGAAGVTFDKHYVVNTTRSINLPSGTDTAGAASLLPSQNDSNPSDGTRPYIPTIGDQLSANNISWKWYSGGWAQIAGYSPAYPAGTPNINPLYPKITDGQYTANNAANQYQYHHQPLAFFDNYAPFGSATVPTAYVGGFAGILPSGVNPGDHGITINQATNSAAHLQDELNFFSDAASGNLPSVCFIKAVGINNEHPGYATLQTGQAHVASIIQALQANPALWANTAVIITYDEHGGRWDHVTPPARDIWGPGVRVPCIVISPLAKKGYVDHISRDTSSILSTIEQRFGVAPLTQRDAAATSFFDVFTALDIARGPYVVNRRANAITQTVTITNRGATPMVGPVQLVLDNLSASSSLINKTGNTANNAPTNSPYITASTGSIAPGASVTVGLQFAIPATGGVDYYARTVVGTTNP